MPVVFLSGQSDPRTVVDCFGHGAADFVAKPGRPDELRARLLHAWTQARRVARLESLARTDGLTGLHNFRALQQRLDEEFARAARYAEPLAVLLVDLDFLKTLNDRYGHDAGNAALRAMGDVFREELRETDFAARFGGDEFVALLPHQTAAEAAVVAERLRLRLATPSLALAAAAHPEHRHRRHGVVGPRPGAVDAARGGRRGAVPEQAKRAEPGGGGRPRGRAPGGHPLRTAPEESCRT